MKKVFLVKRETYDDGSFTTDQDEMEERVSFSHNANHERGVTFELGFRVMHDMRVENGPFQPIYVYETDTDWIHRRVEVGKQRKKPWKKTA